MGLPPLPKGATMIGGGNLAPVALPLTPQQQAEEARKARDQQLQEQNAALAIAAANRAQTEFNLRMQKEREAAAAKAKGKPLSEAAAKDFTEKVDAYEALKLAAASFNRDYVGNPIFGKTETTLQRLTGAGTPGQADWWSAWKTADNQVRNKLFGASLQPSEQKSFAETTIDERVTPEIAQRNIERRLEMARKKLVRETNRFRASGYSDESINASLGDYVPDVSKGYKPFKFITQQPKRAEDVVLGGQAPDKTMRHTPEEERAILDYVNGPNFTPQGWVQMQSDMAAQRGQKIDTAFAAQEAQRIADLRAKGETIGGVSYGAAETAREREVADYLRKQQEIMNAGPLSSLQTPNLIERAAMGTGITNEIAGLGAGIGNVLAGGKFGPAYDIASEAEQKRIQQLRGEQGVPGYLAEFAGGGVASLPFTGAAQRLTALPNVARNVLGDVAFGTAYGAAEARPGERAQGALTGALTSAIAAPATSALTKGGEIMATGLRGGSDVARRLYQQGITPTIGQIMRERTGVIPRMITGAEDAATSIPVIRSIIGARRGEAEEAANLAAGRMALEPVGGAVTEVGSPMKAEIDLAVNNAYAQSLGPMRLTADRPWGYAVTRFNNRVSKLPTELQRDVSDVYSQYIAPAIGPNGEITGDALQQAKRGLIEAKDAIRNSGKIGNDNAVRVIENLEDDFFGIAQRQAPDLYKGYRAADQAFKRGQIVKKSIDSASGRAGMPGQFTGAQLASQAKSAARNYGETPLTGLSEDIVRTLPSQLPTSGTFERIAAGAIPYGIAGGAGYAGTSETVDPATAAMIGATALPFTRFGSNAIAKTLLAPRGPLSTAIGEGIREASPLLRNAVPTEITRQYLTPEEEQQKAAEEAYIRAQRLSGY